MSFTFTDTYVRKVFEGLSNLHGPRQAVSGAIQVTSKHRTVTLPQRANRVKSTLQLRVGNVVITHCYGPEYWRHLITAAQRNLRNAIAFGDEDQNGVMCTVGCSDRCQSVPRSPLVKGRDGQHAGVGVRIATLRTRGKLKDENSLVGPQVCGF